MSFKHSQQRLRPILNRLIFAEIQIIDLFNTLGGHFGFELALVVGEGDLLVLGVTGLGVGGRGLSQHHEAGDAEGLWDGLGLTGDLLGCVVWVHLVG